MSNLHNVKPNTIWREVVMDEDKHLYITVVEINNEFDDVVNYQRVIIRYRYLNDEKLQSFGITWDYIEDFIRFFVPVEDL
jgi:hypothetical protein